MKAHQILNKILNAWSKQIFDLSYIHFLIVLGCLNTQAAETVLILGPSVATDSTGISYEEKFARELGFDVVVVDDQDWGNLTETHFRQYRAIIIGDGDCTGLSYAYELAGVKRDDWGPVVNEGGAVVILGNDPSYHVKPYDDFPPPGYEIVQAAAAKLMRQAIAFAASTPGKTGLYVALGCTSWEGTPEFLEPFGDFELIDYREIESGGADVRIVARHPIFETLSDQDLSYWGNSVHQGFIAEPAGFLPLAIAVPPSGQCEDCVETLDGVKGYPYILARGEGLRPGRGYTAIAVDKNDNAWASRPGQHQKVAGDGITLFSPYETVDSGSALLGGWGNIIDRNNRIWSAKGDQGLVRFEDAVTPNRTDFRAADFGDFNLTLDPVSGSIWTARNGEPVFNFNPNIGPNDQATRFEYSISPLFTFPEVVGIAADKSGNVWLANPDGINRVTHLRTDGTLLGFVHLPCLESPAGAGPRGIAVDGNGKVWTPDFTSGKLFRIDPDSGPIVYQDPSGSFVQRLGAVDLIVDLGADAFPDNYTDMTGLSTASLRDDSGTWSTVFDGGLPDRTWSGAGRVGWTRVLLSNTEVRVKVRAANTEPGLAASTFVELPAGGGIDPTGAPGHNGIAIPAGVAGRFIEIEATLLRQTGAVAGSTPILKNLRISSTTELPALPPETTAELATDDSFMTFHNNVGTSLDVLGNDALKRLSPGVAVVSKVTSAKSGIVTIGPDGASVVYQPNKDFTGTDSFTYTVISGSGAEGLAIVTVHVLGLDTTLPPPVAVDDTATVSGNSINYPIDVLANDSGGALRLISAGQPRYGVAAIKDCDRIVYTPSPNFVGTDTFTYKVSNGSATPGIATVTVTVTGQKPVTINCGDAAISGSLEPADMKSYGRPDYYADVYYLNVMAGKEVTLTLNSAAFHPLLTVKSPRGAIIASASGSPGVPAVQSFTPREAALYTVEVSSVDAQTPLLGTYDLSWVCQQVWVKAGTRGLASGDTLDFGIPLEGSTVVVPLTIGNDGSTPLTIYALSASGDFKVALDQTPSPGQGPLDDFTIPAGGTRDIYAYFIPTWEGDHSGNSLSFQYGAGSSFHLLLSGRANPAGIPPSVVIQSPASQSRYVAPVSIPIIANVSPAVGETLYTVQIYGRRLDQNDYTLLGAFYDPITSPVSHNWNDLSVGDYEIVVLAMDGDGRSTVASVAIRVEPFPGQNVAPTAVDDTRIARLRTEGDSSYAPLQIEVLRNDTDPENEDADPANDDVLLVVGYSQPRYGRVTLAGNVFSFTPETGFLGDDVFAYVITDQKGNYAQAFVRITVVDPHVPTVAIQAPVDGFQATLPLSSGISISAEATAFAPAAIIKVEFFAGSRLLGNVETPSGGLYTFNWDSPYSGNHSFTAVVTDSKGRTGRSNPINVRLSPDPNNIPPIAEITLPTETELPAAFAGGTRPHIQRTPNLEVIGTAKDGTPGQTVTRQLLVYDMDGRMVVQADPVTDAGVNNGSLGTLFLGALSRGTYYLELVVNDGSAERYDQVAFVYESDLQVGQFKFSMEDLAIPVHGINLSVTRTYDSLNSQLGDFGYCWTHSLLDMQMEINEFRDDRIGDDGEIYNVRGGGGWDVTITLPDGKRATFLFDPGTPDSSGNGVYDNISWKTPPGVMAKLESLERLEIRTLGAMYWTYGSSGNAWTPFECFDIPAFKLTMDDGTKYIFTREQIGTWFKDPLESDYWGEEATYENLSVEVKVYGPPRLSKVILPAGGEIRIVAEQTALGGKEFSVRYAVPGDPPETEVETKALLFRRNSQGVISEVFGPDSLDADGVPSGPAALEYYYDTRTNLTEVRALVSKEAPLKHDSTKFFYENAFFPHYLTRIIDPRGIPVARTEYYNNPSDTANHGKIKSITDSKEQVTKFEHLQSDSLSVDRFDMPPPAGYGTPVMREKVTFKPLGENNALGSETIYEADERGNVIYSRDASGFEIWRKYGPPNASFPNDSVQLEESYIVNGVTYLKQWNYENTSEKTKLLATAIIDTHTATTPDNRKRITRLVYNEFGDVTRVYSPEHSQTALTATENDDVYLGTTYYLENIDSPAYRQVKKSYFRVSQPSPHDEMLIEYVYHEAASSPFKGQLWYSTDAQGVVTVNNYYDGSDLSKGRLGDLASVVTYPKGTTHAGFDSTPYFSKTTYTYDGSGNQLSESGWYKERDVFTDVEGLEKQITTSHSYDAKGRVFRTIDATLAASEITYDGTGKQSASTDRHGATTTTYYNRLGEVSGTRYADGTMSYSATYYEDGGASGLLTCRVSEDRHFPFAAGQTATGMRTVQDGTGRTIRTERITGLVIDFSISGNNEVYDTKFVAATPASSTLTSYYTDGRVWKTVEDYNCNGNADALEPVTEYQYATDGLSKTTILPDATGLNNDGTTYTDHTVIIETYDLNGQLETSQTKTWRAPDGGTATLLPHRPLTVNTYDHRGRRTQTAIHDDENDTSGDLMSLSKYDAADRVWLQVDADGHGTAFIYDDAGQLSWVITDVPSSATLPSTVPASRAEWLSWAGGANSTATEYRYNELGQLRVQTDAEGRQTRFEYDNLGRRTSRFLPGQTTWDAGEHWHYDFDEAAGATVTTGDKRPNKVSHLDFLKQRVTMVYDSAGRLDQKKSSPATVLVDYDYTPSGSRSQMRDNFSARTTRYVYDELNRLRIKAAPEGTLTYTYDSKQNLQSISTKDSYTFPTAEPYTLQNTIIEDSQSGPDGVYMEYTYDERHRLITVNADASSADATYAYDAVGNQKRMKYRNGVETAYTYNPRNQLRRVRSYLSNTPATLLANFDYDEVGISEQPNPSSSSWGARALSKSGRRNRLQEDGLGATRRVDYDYDNLNRLTLEAINASGTIRYNGNGSDLQGYDQVGNRRSRISNVTGVASTIANVVFDVNDRLDDDATPTTLSLNFDANGNTLKPDLNGDGVIDGAEAGYNYTYDFENRLITATGGGKTVQIIYDGDGNWVQKTVNGTVTKYLVDDRNLNRYSQVLEERDGSGNTSVGYVYGLDLVSLIRNTGTHDSPVWDKHYYGYDGLGSVRYLTDGNLTLTDGTTLNPNYGTLTDTYTYDAFGILVGRSGDTPNNYLYAGEQWDADLGMYYLRARYYNPQLGRFWTMDSYEGDQHDPLGMHKYLYCRANSVNMVDPSGNDGSQTAVGQIGLTGNIGIVAKFTLPAINAGRIAALNKIGQAVGVATVGYLAADVMMRVKVRDEIEKAKREIRRRMGDIDFPAIVPISERYMKDVYNHIVDYQTANPISMFLVKADPGKHKANRQAIKAEIAKKGPAGIDKSWDEYPFAISTLGGNPTTVSLRPVNWLHNAIQGGVIRASFVVQKVNPGDSFWVVPVPDMPDNATR